jgi:SAM-dependent methyltransferase
MDSRYHSPTPTSFPALRTEGLFNRYYRSKPGYLGGTEQFHDLCARNLVGGKRILEIGPGPANPTTAFLATLGSVAGVDVSDEIHANPHLSESYVCSGSAFPFASKAFDMCVSNYVLEHVADPVAHFSEVCRVLRPGAAYCFRTPNRLHYVAFASNLLPHSLHRHLANKLRALDKYAHDPWPTHYLANDRKRLIRLARETGLVPEQFEMVEKEPSYGAAHWLLFFPMMGYERLVNLTPRFSFLRANIFGVFRKPIGHLEHLSDERVME